MDTAEGNRVNLSFLDYESMNPLHCRDYIILSFRSVHMTNPPARRLYVKCLVCGSWFVVCGWLTRPTTNYEPPANHKPK